MFTVGSRQQLHVHVAVSNMAAILVFLVSVHWFIKIDLMTVGKFYFHFSHAHTW